MSQSLADKLKSLGVKVGTSSLTQSRLKRGTPIEQVVEGQFVSTEFGETFIHENRYPLEYQHGQSGIQLSASLDVLAQWVGETRLSGLPLETFVFLDTETSGLAGGTGTYAFMVGVGRFEGSEFHLAQFFMRDPAEEPALLSALNDFLAPAQVLVTYNGKAFDAPLLRTRYRLHSAPVPFADFIHIDLLPLARRLWRERLPSRTLKYIEENVLGAQRTSEEVPGHEIPYIYFDYLRTGDASPLKGVFYHNSMDVVTLAALLNHTAHMLADPLHESIEHGLDRIALARLYEDLGKWDEAAQVYERGLQDDLPEADFWQFVQRLSILQRRRGDLEAAFSLWEKAAAEGHIYAHIELAKHYEHRRGDPVEALRWTLTARALVEELSLPIHVRKHWLDEIDRRRGRLERKTTP
jgi:uncharacterized protein YprB with RNaseH-like and TPR domain